MRKFLILVAVFALFCLLLCGCGEKSVVQKSSDLAYANIYREAVALGFEGSLNDFLELVRGAEGNGISKVLIDEMGNLVITYTKEQEACLVGRVKGENGRDGNSIVGVELNEHGELLILMSNNPNTPVNLGKVANLEQRQGVDGKDGSDGIDGQNGKDGKDGQNGIDGQNGKDGKDGQNGIDGQNGKDGSDGQNGMDGKNGKSAYEIYLEYYPEYTKSEAEWLIDLIKGNLIPKHNVYFHFYEDFESVEVVLDGEKVSTPQAERSGYTFLGWMVGSVEGAAYNFDLPVQNELHLYAKYAKKEPQLEEKGFVYGPCIIQADSFYKFYLISGITGLIFEGTQGDIEFKIYDIFGSDFITETYSFSSSKTAFIADLSIFVDCLDQISVTVKYTGESGYITMNLR